VEDRAGKPRKGALKPRLAKAGRTAELTIGKRGDFLEGRAREIGETLERGVAEPRILVCPLKSGPP
jgi:hypothetical protein